MNRMKWMVLAGTFLGMGSMVGCGTEGGTLEVELPGGETMEMVWIEPGTFTMGSPDSEERGGDEKPQHEVKISRGFYLGKYEITQAQWKAVMGTTPWSTGRDSVVSGQYVCGRHHVQSGSNKPAAHISWDDVQDLVRRLNRTAGDSLYRLPTEAEWEYACRAGTATRWSFGDDVSRLGEYAWYGDNVAGEYARPVGTKLPNPWGLHDMHGNVEEWVQDLYGFYPGENRVDPTGPTPTRAYRGGPSGQEVDLATSHPATTRVFRGGSFYINEAWDTRSAIRFIDSPSARHSYLGARLLRTR